MEKHSFHNILIFCLIWLILFYFTFFDNFSEILRRRTKIKVLIIIITQIVKGINKLYLIKDFTAPKYLKWTFFYHLINIMNWLVWLFTRKLIQVRRWIMENSNEQNYIRYTGCARSQYSYFLSYKPTLQGVISLC